MSARSAVALAIALVGTWAVPGPAAALEPGVFVDPGSPAGKEYSVPLSVLRGSASGHPAVEDEAQPLFGIGITPVRAGGAAPAREHGRPDRTAAGGGGPTAPPGGATGAGSARSTVLAGISTSEGSATPAVALFVALVVLGGLGLGAVLVAVRRRMG
jgi:hypothetical protein